MPIVMALILVVISSACGGTTAKPTAVPPTATPVPTRVPRLPIIAVPPEEVSDALIAAMPQEGWYCIEKAVGSERLEAFTSGSEPESAEQAAQAVLLLSECMNGEEAEVFSEFRFLD